MKLIKIGDFVINLDNITHAQLSGEYVKVYFTSSGAGSNDSLRLTGDEAKAMKKALLGLAGEPPK
jgi:hypothetical protein